MTHLLYKIFSLVAVNAQNLTIVLLVTVGIFLFFIILAIIKMYKLEAEHKKLVDSDSFKIEIDDVYRDFTQGHLYENN